MLNFAELYSAVQGLMERSDTNLLTKIKDGLNAGYRSVADKRPWSALLRQTTISGVSGLDYIITGQEVDQIIDLSQRETPVLLALQRYAALLSRNVDIITNTGNPTVASPSGEIGVKAALPSDGTIDVVSSSASDSTQKVRIQGYSASTLIPITELISLNGTGTVTSTNSYSSKEGYEPRFSKDGTTTGIITITRSSTTIAQLAPAELQARYKKWKIWPVFSSNLTMYLTFKKRVYQLVNDEDVPELECDNALILYAYAYCLREKRQTTKAAEILGRVDADGHYTPGTFMFELDQLIAKEPQFTENFNDQFLPQINRDSIDMQSGQIGYQLWPSS